MHCHLLIPGFTPTIVPGANLVKNLRLPALEALLARAGRSELQPGGMAAWLCREFAVDKKLDWPVAPLTLLAQGGEPGSDFWLLAAPVHLQLQRDRMVLADAAHLDITADEAAGLTAALNLHFAEDGLTFLPTRPDSWHVRLAAPAELETHALESVVGRNIRRFLPHGADGLRWHRILNEIQMLLHSHPVNRQREQRGALPVNSIWPWGGGTLPMAVSSPYRQVWANDALTRGLALAADAPLAATPETAGGWLQTAAPGVHLVVVDALQGAARSGDLAGWSEILARLETDWFEPLRQALALGRIDRLSLHVPGDAGTWTFSVCRADLWKFWRGRKPLKTFVGELSA